MLSDVGGVIVEQYGILNPNIPRDHPIQAAGLPFPGQFLIAPDGTILGKAFTGDLRHRASGTTLVLEHFGRTGEPTLRIDTDELRAEITCSSSRVFPGQELGVLIEVEVEPGWHVYGSGVASPYTPFAIEFEAGEDSVVVAQSFDVPRGMPMALTALGETLPVLDGRFQVSGRLRLRWSPPATRFPEMADTVRALQVPAGEYELRASLGFQACSADTCLPPAAVELVVPIVIDPHVTVEGAGDPRAERE